jgi:hypothetical protein
LSLAHNTTCDNTLPSPHHPSPPIIIFCHIQEKNFKKERKGEDKPHKTPSLKEHSPKVGFRV